MPRLQRILVSDRCYELVSDDEIRAAQLEIQREVEPQIKELISRAEEGLEGLQRRERTLNEAVSVVGCHGGSLRCIDVLLKAHADS